MDEWSLLNKVARLKKYSKKLKRCPNNANLQIFVKKISKDVKASVKAVKALYYKNKFDNVGNDSKRSWRVIDEVLGRNSEQRQVTQIYKWNSDTIITDSQSISDEFNNFFANVSLHLSSNIPVSNHIEFNRYILGSPRYYSFSCFFEPINSLEILSVIKNLKNKRSKGIDKIDNNVVKKCSWYLLDVLNYLFNMSLNSGIFPDVFKLALVVPIYKKGDELHLNNYRPISLLSTISKLLEKLVKRRLLGYLDKIKFLHNSQFGFRAGKSTEEALLHFLNQIFKSINTSLTPAALYIDIAKAFDSVDHDILIKKLDNMGVRGSIGSWFNSYLRNRRQVVKIGESISDQVQINCGVPQGSVLGPLLFLIYFNSIFGINLIGHPTAFADDLALSYASDRFAEIQLLLQRDLATLSKWFYQHRLAMSDKSRLMIFGRTGTELMVSNAHFYHMHSCNRNPCLSQCFQIQTVTEFKYLGLTIDSQLTWSAHLSNIRKHVVMAVYKFYKLRQFCPPKTLRKLYHALVESIIMYGISSWGGVYYTNIKDLYIAQKRIVKLIYRQPRTTPTIPLFRELNLLPLRYLYVFKVLKIFFVRSNSFHSRIIHDYNLRNPNTYLGLRCNREKFRRCYLFMAPYWFHMLPINLKSLTTERKHQCVLGFLV